MQEFPSPEEVPAGPHGNYSCSTPSRSSCGRRGEVLSCVCWSRKWDPFFGVSQQGLRLIEKDGDDKRLIRAELAFEAGGGSVEYNPANVVA